ncbi:choice-of-anchor D domain-containing protein [Flavobacteriaceae bacterium AU392]|nr:choice-of-anchor D domain-containing protein [Flavobacteriaceae bacterium]RKM83488.1 choice-of-anchor D domain-containing protein [Flavobacteriaceae bacterium AU392]
MKKITFLLRSCAFIFIFLISTSIFSQTCVTPAITTYPYSESFEANIGVWTQDTGDDFNWLRDSGGTPSNGTGPSTGAAGSFYMYTEATSNFNNTANFESPCFDLSGTSSAQFTFEYHMFGSNMGTLNVDVSTDNGATYPTTLFTRTGQQEQTSNGAAWTPVNIDLSAFIGQTIKLRFNGTTGPQFRSDMAIDNVSLTVVAASPPQEINITGLGNNILNGDVTPDFTDDTDYGNVDTAVGSVLHTFTIQNLGSVNDLNLTSSPRVIISGTHAADFTLTTDASTPVTALSNTTFGITFNPSADGLRTATVTIANNDTDEGSYTFSIQGTGASVCSSMVITLPYNEDFETGTNGWNSGGADANRVNDPARAYSNDFSLQIRDDSGVASSFCSPLVDISPFDKVDFKFFFSASSFDTGEDFFIEYSPDGGSTWQIVATYVGGDVPSQTGDFQNDTSLTFYSKTATMRRADFTFASGAISRFRIRADASDDDDLVYIDNITITGTTYNTPTIGPGGITSDLNLWLKADKLDGVSTGTDGSSVINWSDSGLGNDATPILSALAPVYRNNATNNFNFNPVIDFINNPDTAPGDMTYIAPDRDVLSSTAGFNSNDIFVVLLPDPTVNSTSLPLDTFTSDDPNAESFSEDVTGFGFRSYTARFTGERFTYAIGTTTDTDPGPGVTQDGYGRAVTDASINFNQIQIINTRHNSTNDGIEIAQNGTVLTSIENDPTDFSTVTDTRFWLGRSQYYDGSYDGRIAEVITFSNRKGDADLTQERNRIQSYLAIKYGITLGANGTSQDYVNSSGTVIWDQSANAGFNFDIAGIGRDDASGLDQRQSSSVNTLVDATGETLGIVSMGLTQLYDTNSENIASNPTTFTDGQYLTWGNNGVDLNLAASTINVDMSAGIAGLSTPVTFIGMQRVWKVVENGGDIPSVQVSIPENAVRNITPPGSFLMFISDTGVFDPTADYRVMTPDGSGNLLANYNFDGTKFITFGYAPEVIVERSIFFDGVVDYIDMEDNLDLNTSEYTISAWIKRASGSLNSSILSKRDAANTVGYDFKIDNTGHLEFSINGGAQNIVSNIVIPEDEWHQVAVIYSGGNATLYIDGVPDLTGSVAMGAPVATNQSFLIAAADGFDPNTTAYYEGNVDEVRVWDVALSVDQLRYVMNQEIEANASFVDGQVMPSSITRNDVSSIPWTDLAGYYPMSVYTYTNTNDESSNNNQGALRNLDTVDFQTAPLPYESNQNGDWDTNATWTNGNELTIPGAASIADPTVAVGWNIVRMTHDLTMDNFFVPEGTNGGARSLLGLFIDSPTSDLTLMGTTTLSTGMGTGNGLLITHYLSLDGKIDLEGESQLIQALGSDLDPTSAGIIEKDQQGTQDLYTYNYWSSPAGVSNTSTNNNSYTFADIYMDGSDPANPLPINFITGGFNGTPGSAGVPIGIADYWIFKFTDFAVGNIAGFQQVRSTGTLLPGEGFTLKGVADTSGNVDLNQNYVTRGKPNNGDINLSISANNNYLVGNPYASAIDANQFILDNGPVIEGGAPGITGTLYFWDHFGGGSHILREYQGGYATYNLAGGTPPAVSSSSVANSHPDLPTGGIGTLVPGRFIPVGQGFFVLGETNGTINFNNGQRRFVVESIGNSVFFGIEEQNLTLGETNPSSINNTTQSTGTTDDRMKIRFAVNTVNSIHRQMLVTVDPNASAGFDWGYEAPLNEEQIDDMYWLVEDGRYNIQGIDIINNETVMPIGIHTGADGDNSFTLDELENVPDNLEIFINDKELNVQHNLRESDYEFFLIAGEHLERFELVFNVVEEIIDDDDDIVITENIIENLGVFYSNNSKNIVIINPEFKNINSLEMINLLGQSVYSIEDIPNNDRVEYRANKLATGTYIIRMNTDEGILTKKVLVQQ